MRVQLLLIPLRRHKKPAVTASTNLPVTIVCLEIDDAKNIKEIRLMVDTMGERRK
jgi:hypothetical protein